MTESPEPPGESRRFKFPTAFTVPVGLLLLVWIASFSSRRVSTETDGYDG